MIQDRVTQEIHSLTEIHSRGVAAVAVSAGVWYCYTNAEKIFYVCLLRWSRGGISLSFFLFFSSGKLALSPIQLFSARVCVCVCVCVTGNAQTQTG